MKSSYIKIRSALVAVLLCCAALSGCGEKKPVTNVTVANIEWNCTQRPCHAEFDLTNPGSESLNVVVEIRGFNFAADLALPRPKLFVGKREYIEPLNANETRRFSEGVQFTRFPAEIEVEVVRTEVRPKD